jgi:hypothetical protein
MRKMLAIFALLALARTAVAPPPDRSALSYEENVIIITACGNAAKQSNAAFQSCVSKQMGSLQDHLTPDLSALPGDRHPLPLSTPSRHWPIQRLRREGDGSARAG